MPIPNLPTHSKSIAALVSLATCPANAYFDKLAEAQAMLESLPPPRRNTVQTFCDDIAQPAVVQLAKSGRASEAHDLIEAIGSLLHPTTKRPLNETRTARKPLEELRSGLRSYAGAESK